MEKELREQAFANLTILRNKNISLLENISQDVSHVIPEKFSNNLFWQAGHILTTQFSLLYRRSNLPIPMIDSTYLNYFSKGSSPSDFDSKIPSFLTLQKELKDSLEVVRKDLHIHASAKYDNTVVVSFGMTLNSFHDAILALPYHESYHMNAINLLAKQLKN